MTKTVMKNVRIAEKEDLEFRKAIEVYNSNSPIVKVSMTSIIRGAIIKFIKKNNGQES